jgi:antirestriction protein
MERQPHTPEGGEPHPHTNHEVNSYGTDDPAAQERIEQARIEASRERRRNRAQLEQLVDAGLSADDAETVIEFEHAARDGEREASDELLPDQPPRIYITDVAAQEIGRLHGRWIEATDNLPDIREQIGELLVASPVAGAERFAITDHRGFLGYQPSDQVPLETVATIASGIFEHGPAFAAYVTLVGEDEEQLHRFDERHVGSFDSAEAWAIDVGNELEWQRHLDTVVDPMLRPYVRIDYARFARDSQARWDMVEGPDGQTHVFLR